MPNQECRHRTTCRLCQASRLVLAVPYPPTPIADAYLDSPEAAAAQPRYPLDLYLCEACGHVQLCDVVDPDLLFRGYTYETSVSLGLVEHFRRYADQVAAEVPGGAERLVVEIGSNDGSLLRFFKDKGWRVLGVDPAERIAAKATQAGIPTLPTYFDRALAARIVAEHGPADLVTANNVFAHSDALPDMAEGIAGLLAPAGLFSFEVSYLPDILRRMLFDTVYHEHLCYHAVDPMQAFFRRHGLELTDFIPLETKGGSFRGLVKRREGPRRVDPSVPRQLALEREEGFGSLAVYRAFSDALQALRSELRALLGGLRGEGKRLAGFGASATVTTLMHYFGLHEFLDFLVDDNPKKHHTYTPGAAVEVLPPSALLERRPDAVVILAWAYAEPIMAKHAAYQAQGGRFIRPLPRVEVL